MTSDQHATEQYRATQRLSVGRYVALACQLEVVADKPGNVTPRARFAQTSLLDFLVSAEVISQVMDRAGELPVGTLILESVRATQNWVGQNTNLGLILLLAPLAKGAASAAETLTPAHVREVLAKLDAHDAQQVFTAIRTAAPGGLGRVERFDVHRESPADLLAAMQLAAAHDLVAAQYVTDFSTVFAEVLPWLRAECAAGWPLTAAIVTCQLRMLARHGDSLIARKCGGAVAADAAERAAAVLHRGSPDSAAYRAALREFDAWLRESGNQRNPGTTADLIGAALFVGLFNRELLPPWR